MSEPRKASNDNQGDPQLSALYRRTRRPEPPPELDLAIRQAAHTQARHRRRRWLVPLSSAAAILLGATLTLQVIDLEKPLEQDIAPASLPVMEAADTDAPAAPAESLRMQKSVPTARFQSAAPSSAPMPAPTKEQEEHLDAVEMKKELTALPLKPEAPETWLSRIRSLAAEGNREEAKKQLTEFRRRYPQFPLPAEMQKLLAPKATNN